MMDHFVAAVCGFAVGILVGLTAVAVVTRHTPYGISVAR